MKVGDPVEIEVWLPNGVGWVTVTGQFESTDDAETVDVIFCPNSRTIATGTFPRARVRPLQR